jgi:dinuclear metal center YbgI/SA1388 family protein
MSVPLHDIVSHLDRFLDIAGIPDYPGAFNGLQVENGGAVTKVAVAVDACQATIDEAVAIGADLLLVHHGLFWGRTAPIVAREWRRLRALIQNDVAVYSVHLPLDSHPDVGNNAILAQRLGVSNTVGFGLYEGHPIGVAGDLALPRDELVARVTSVLGASVHVIPAGPENIERIGVITGGGGSMIEEAKEAGLDAFVTGEGAHHTHFDAEEGDITVSWITQRGYDRLHPSGDMGGRCRISTFFQ